MVRQQTVTLPFAGSNPVVHPELPVKLVDDDNIVDEENYKKLNFILFCSERNT